MINVALMKFLTFFRSYHPMLAALGVGVLLGLENVAPAHASVAIEATLPHLVEQAEAVLEGTAEESKAVWEPWSQGQRIVTYTRLQVHHVVYGSVPEAIWVRTLGGKVGNLSQRVGGETLLPLGERAVVFMQKIPNNTAWL
jgi:hypothetical protein